MADIQKNKDATESSEDTPSSTISLHEISEAVEQRKQPIDEMMSKQGVPKAVGVEDVEAYLKEKDLELEAAQRQMHELYSKYKSVENAIQEKRTRLLSNLPDFENSLNYIATLKQAKEKGSTELGMLYKLEENSYQRATITDLEKVVLFLGGSTFAEFELDEAEKLLKNNVSGINRLMASLKDELNWIRDQATTCEVSMAHLYNYGVRQKKTSP